MRDRPPPQRSKGDEGAPEERPRLSARDVEDKYLRMLERPLAPDRDRAVQELAGELQEKHPSAAELREAWHDWRLHVGQPEDGGQIVDPLAFRLCQEKNLAFAEALRRAEPDVQQQREEAGQKELEGQYDAFMAALGDYAPAPVAAPSRGEVLREEAAPLPEAAREPESPRELRVAATPEELRVVRAEAEERLLRGPPVDVERAERALREMPPHELYLRDARQLEARDPERYQRVQKDLERLRDVGKLQDPTAIERELTKTSERLLDSTDDDARKQLYARSLSLSLLLDERTAPLERQEPAPESAEPSALRSAAASDVMRPGADVVRPDATTQERARDAITLDDPTDAEHRVVELSDDKTPVLRQNLAHFEPTTDPEPPTIPSQPPPRERELSERDEPTLPLVRALEAPQLPDHLSESPTHTAPIGPVRDERTEPRPMPPGLLASRPETTTTAAGRAERAAERAERPQLEPEDPREQREVAVLVTVDRLSLVVEHARRFNRVESDPEYRDELRERVAHVEKELTSHEHLERGHERLEQLEQQLRRDDLDDSEDGGIRLEAMAVAHLCDGYRIHRENARAALQSRLVDEVREMGEAERKHIIEEAVRYAVTEMPTGHHVVYDLDQHLAGRPYVSDVDPHALPFVRAATVPRLASADLLQMELAGDVERIARIQEGAEQLVEKAQETPLGELSLRAELVRAHAARLLDGTEEATERAVVCGRAIELIVDRAAQAKAEERAAESARRAETTKPS